MLRKKFKRGNSWHRLLDSNRALYVPELQEEVTPHPHFMLFATQNPAGAYGGRKPLSRAFRSRFLELQVADIPDSELAEILTTRCRMAGSRAKCLVSAMHELQRRRQVGTSRSSPNIPLEQCRATALVVPLGEQGTQAGSWNQSLCFVSSCKIVFS